jgi:hypothetical protein
VKSEWNGTSRTLTTWSHGTNLQLEFPTRKALDGIDKERLRRNLMESTTFSVELSVERVSVGSNKPWKDVTFVGK